MNIDATERLKRSAAGQTASGMVSDFHVISRADDRVS
jgi:hypothetical protein